MNHDRPRPGSMRLVLAMTMKDLRRALAEPAGTLLSLGIPLAIAGTMALAFGGGASHPVLQVVLVDLDDSPISNTLAGASQNEEAAKHLVVHRAASTEEGLAALRATRSAAMVVIPEGFMKDLLEGRATRLTIEKNPSQSIMPVVADQGLQAVALYLSAGRRLLGDEATRLLDLMEGERWEETLALAAMVETLRQRVLSVDDLLLPPLIEVGTAAHEEEETEEGGGAFEFLSWMFPGMIVMALLFVGTVQMKDLLRESKQGTLRRLLASPAGAHEVLLSKVLAVAAVVTIAHLVLLLVGWVAFGMVWSDWVALTLASLALVGAVTGFNALIFAAARTEGQGDAFAGVLIMLMSILGGAFLPTQGMPGWLQGVARGTLNHWANEALRGIASGSGLSEIALPLGVLAGMAVVFTLLGVALLRLRHLRGAA